MGKEDIELNAYLSDTRRYADLWNASVFEGRQMIKAEELQEINSVIPKADGDTVIQKTRDIVMKQRYDGQRFAIFTVENQKNIDYGMAVRIMLQEALEYHKQVREIVRKNERNDKEYHEEGKLSFYRDDGEFLYKVRSGDRIHPVVTLVVYWGEEEWTGAKSLHELIDFGDERAPMVQELKRLVPEYPLHFLNLAEFEHMDYFKTELRPLLELYKRRNDKREFMKYVETNEGHWNMDEETWYVLSQLTHSKKLQNIIKEKNKKEGEEKGMCKAIDDLENDAIEKGKAIGKSEAIIELLEEYGEVSNELRSMISSQNNLDILSRWFKLAIKVSSVQEFSDKI